MEIVFGLSAWLVIPALVLAALLSYFFYRFRTADLEISATLKWIFTGLRFVVLFVLLVLLLEPLIKTLTTKVEKPVVLVLLDQSESMVMAKDSTQVKTGLKPALDELKDELGDDYQVDLAGFDEDLKPEINYNFKGKVTDLGKTTASLASAYANANLGAIVVLSDGIINRGESPVYNLNQIKAPIYTVAVGDTTPKLDAAIVNLNTNRTAFKGNEFPVIVSIRGTKLKAQSGKVELMKGGRVVGSQTFSIGSDNFTKEFNFVLKADQPGVQQYVARVTNFSGETVTANNARSFFIDVLENKEKILLLYSHMHPDVGALAKGIEGIENYELEVADASGFAGNFAESSLVIFHQAGPMDAGQRRLLDNLQKMGKPIWLFLGPNSDWNYLNQTGLGIKLSGAQGQTQVQARINETFQLFAGDVLSQKQLYDIPPVAVPFGDLTCAPSILTLYYQQVDRITTTTPLLAFSQQSAGARRGFFFGEGIWKWRMNLFAGEQNHAAFDGMISRAVQYLTAQGNKKQLLVNADKYYEEGSDIVLGAELYNEAAQFVSGQEILLSLNYNDSVKYSYAFNKGSVGYDLALKGLTSGSYSYSATTTYAGKKLVDSGKFIVESSDLEAAYTTADHNLLYQLSLGSGGKMIYQNQLSKLADMIKENPVVKPVSYSSSAVFDAVKLKWIFFLVVILLTAEWFMRKRNGLN